MCLRLVVGGGPFDVLAFTPTHQPEEERWIHEGWARTSFSQMPAFTEGIPVQRQPCLQSVPSLFEAEFCATGRKTKTSFHQKCTDGRMAWHVLVYGGIPRQKKENSFWVSDGAIPPPYSASSAVWRHPLSLRKLGCQFSAARLLSVAISIFCGHHRCLLIFCDCQS